MIEQHWASTTTTTTSIATNPTNEAYHLPSSPPRPTLAAVKRKRTHLIEQRRSSTSTLGALKSLSQPISIKSASKMRKMRDGNLCSHSGNLCSLLEKPLFAHGELTPRRAEAKGEINNLFVFFYSFFASMCGFFFRRVFIWVCMHGRIILRMPEKSFMFKVVHALECF